MDDELEVFGRFPNTMINHDNVTHYRGLLERRLLVNQCQQCGYWIYPHRPLCPECWSWDVTPTEVSGRGVIYMFTVVVQTPCRRGPARRRAAAAGRVELEEQVGSAVPLVRRRLQHRGPGHRAGGRALLARHRTGPVGPIPAGGRVRASLSAPSSRPEGPIDGTQPTPGTGRRRRRRLDPVRTRPAAFTPLARPGGLDQGDRGRRHRQERDRRDLRVRRATSSRSGTPATWPCRAGSASTRRRGS